MNCILCGNDAEIFEVIKGKKYFHCDICKAVMLNSKNYLSAKEEKERYKTHNNDVEDKRYQSFVFPIVREVFEDYNQSHNGLDFGAGTGPVISKLLKDKDYNIKIYDPFFANYPEKLDVKYDYIVCCEVIEHFYNPSEEFKLLKSLLEPGGTLYLKTSIYSKDIEFKSWHYKNDPTHVFFYQKETLEWIRNYYGFSSLEIKKDVIVFSND